MTKSSVSLDVQPLLNKSKKKKNKRKKQKRIPTNRWFE